MADSHTSLNGSSLRILCLHDAHSNAGELSAQLSTLGDRLLDKHSIELVYINAPLLSPKASSEASEPLRLWWDCQPNEDESTPSYVGFDASLLLLKQVWSSMPFWGILAVGQGASIGSFLPLLPVDPMPAFCIFVHGQTVLTEDELLIDNLPCLSILDSAEPSESCRRLQKQFDGECMVGSRDFDNKTINAIGKFVIAQKKTLKKSAGNALALQNELHRVEQEATQLIAKSIALDPPKCLLAVFAPQTNVVGGWLGDKRRKPDEEGGGAPCPAEFLYNRENKTAYEDGPSRVHPPSANKEKEEQCE